MDKREVILHNTEVGKMKDEITNGSIIEACFLEAKAYCYSTVYGKERKNQKE